MVVKKGVKKNSTPKKQCEGECKRDLALTRFYNTNSAFSSDGKLNICKDCLEDMIDCNNIETIYKILQLMDVPFLTNYWEISKEKNPDNPWGNYIRMANSKINEFKNKTWKDSIFANNENINKSENKNTTSKMDDFILTDEIIDKWNAGYSKEEYYYFEKKWNKLIDNYGEKTSFHVEGLITYIRFRVKEELATARGDSKEAKEWANMAKDAATAAKINVSQLSKSDISGGVELVPQIFEAVESKVGVISILPKLKEQPMDDADLIIWCIVNYNRRLEDKPRVEYKEIWNFYDEMLQEYFQNQGYTKEQVIIEKDKRNSIFRDLGKVYIEPVYEEGE
jgi:hypothetical protein